MRKKTPFNTTPSIGVFDSGVGGLSVLKAIREREPSVDLLYIADSGNAPYGSESFAFIEGRAERIASALQAAGVQLIVVACNTATVVAIESLRAQLDIPIVAIEPAIKPAISETKTGIVGVLATERTLDSDSTKRLCQKFGSSVRILLQPCPGLVELVECGNLASDQTIGILQAYIDPLIAQGVDTLVLGCTHYVFLESTIKGLVGPNIRIVQPSSAVAVQASRRLGHCNAEGGQATGRQRFFTTGNPVLAEMIFSQLWGSSVRVEYYECK